MVKPKKKPTAAQRSAKEQHRKDFMTIFINGTHANGKKCGGQDARATVARASCPEPSETKSCANLTVLGETPPARPAAGRGSHAHVRGARNQERVMDRLQRHSACRSIAERESHSGRNASGRY